MIDYEVSHAILPGAYSVVSQNNLALNDIDTGLISGDTYSYRVRARNSFGYSEYSSLLSLLIAFVPN